MQEGFVEGLVDLHAALLLSPECSIANSRYLSTHSLETQQLFSSSSSVCLRNPNSIHHLTKWSPIRTSGHSRTPISAPVQRLHARRSPAFFRMRRIKKKRPASNCTRCDLAVVSKCQSPLSKVSPRIIKASFEMAIKCVIASSSHGVGPHERDCCVRFIAGKSSHSFSSDSFLTMKPLLNPHLKPMIPAARLVRAESSSAPIAKTQQERRHIRAKSSRQSHPQTTEC